MNAIPKVVFSRTLKTTDGWPEILIASGDTPEEIAKAQGRAQQGSRRRGRHRVHALADQARCVDGTGCG
jgi:hypothetical protein